MVNWDKLQGEGEALGYAAAVHLNDTEAMIMIRNREFIGFCKLLWKS